MSATRVLFTANGGGMLGLAAAVVLAELERRTGQKARDLAHAWAGTSTGGLLAVSLAHGVPARDLVEFYQVDGPRIFQASLLRRGLSYLSGATYSPDALEQSLRNILGDATLCGVQPYNLLAPAYCLRRAGMVFFKSWRAAEPGRDYYLRDVCRATSAAPTYFAPARIRSLDGLATPCCVDGGLGCNNPSAALLASARRKWPDARRFVIVNLSTGYGSGGYPCDAAQHWGAVRWAVPVVDTLLDAQAEVTTYTLEQDPQVDVLRIDFDMATAGVRGKMDDASPGQIDALTRAGNAMAELHLPRILAALADINPKTTEV